MRIATSSIGHLAVGMKSLALTLGHEWVDTARPGLAGLARTRRHSPEYCCYPFRLALADLLSALDRGADTLVFFGGKGICRLSMYEIVQRELIEREGRAFRSHVVSGSIRERLYGPVREESPYRDSWTYTPRTFLGFWKLMKKLEVIACWRRALDRVRPRAAEPARATALFAELVADLDRRHGTLDLLTLGRRGERALAALPHERRLVLPRVGIIGEAYAVIDEFTNRRVFERLAALGIEPVCHLSEHLFMQVVTRIYYRTERRTIARAFRFFGAPGGGDSLLSAGHAVEYADTCDGVLHLYPFTCLPETSVRQVVEPWLRARQVPYLGLNLDEQTAEEGFVTRLETFADVVREQGRGRRR